MKNELDKNKYVTAGASCVCEGLDAGGKNTEKYTTADTVKVATAGGFGIAEWCELVKKGASIDMKLYPSGVSMLPLIRGNKDQVMVKPIKRELKKGDIVLFERADGAHVLHRLWKIGDEVKQVANAIDIVQTYGDGCWYPDQPISRDKVLAIAYKLYRDGKAYNLDTALERTVGRAWLFASPLRRMYYRARNIFKAIVRKLTGRK